MTKNTLSDTTDIKSILLAHNIQHNMTDITTISGKSKENTLNNKIWSLIRYTDVSDVDFWKAAQVVVAVYTVHPNTSMLTEMQILALSEDKWFWIVIDLFEWRWKKKIQDIFPWWEFTHNTGSHYMIEPEVYECPEETWKNSELLIMPLHHIMYNIPAIDSPKLAYWDVFGVDGAHSEVVDYIVTRGCPKDLESFVYRCAADDKLLLNTYQKWGRRGIAQHIVICTEEISGITLYTANYYSLSKTEEISEHVKLMRHSTWPGKFYKHSVACPPRERIGQEGIDIPIVVEVIAPTWLHNMRSLEESYSCSSSSLEAIWEKTGVPGGKHWMIDVIWANLTHAERAEIVKMHKQCVVGDEYIQYWLYIQLVHNWGDCFTDKSKDYIKSFYSSIAEHISATFKEKHKWMITPREVTL